MSEPGQNMKALETETSSFSSSLVKNNDNQKQKQKDIIQALSDQSSNKKNVNLGLSLGGVYGSTSSSGATPPGMAQNDVVDVGPRPSSPPKSASRNPGPCRVIPNITTDNLGFQTEAGGHEVLPQMRFLVRSQFTPARRRPTRSNNLTQSARAIAQRKLQQLIASVLNARPVDPTPVNSSSCGDLVPAGIKFQNSLASPSYVEPIVAGTETGNPLVSNSVEVSGIMLQNGPAPVLKGTVNLIQNTSSSDSNVEFGGTNFQNNATRLDSNGESAEFVGTNFENAPIGSNGSLTEYVGTVVPNDASKVENEGGGSSSNEKTLEEIVAGAEETEENQEAKRVKLSNKGYGDYERRVLKKMPTVVSKGDDPNAMRVHGFLYKYTEGDVKMVCSCHGFFLTPTQFLKHAGVSDLSNPLRKIIVHPFNI
ncbi:Ninja-family protein 2 [Euphorbia peplus]|nr:Ninja-family protein 2 [Euphorbia peplus]